jgi:prepilin-type N-terminal cleavage/methylation domain-containing protein
VHGGGWRFFRLPVPLTPAFVTAVHPSTQWHRARAFTLVEVLVVLVLLALSIAVVAPVLKRPSPTERAGEALQQVRSRAARLGVSLDTTVDGRRLRITPLGACLPITGDNTATRWDPARCAPAVTTP